MSSDDKGNEERMAGVEPVTLGLGSRCSTTELHPHFYNKFKKDRADSVKKYRLFVNKQFKALSDSSLINYHKTTLFL